MVSGGADSTALLVRACTGMLDLDDGRGTARVARERLHVLHMNHHLRGEASDGDEHFVRELAARFGLPVRVEHFDPSVVEKDGAERNLEAAAREARYAAARRYVRDLCAEYGCNRRDARIVTAHTASDRAETFLMNAIRGAGPAGLSSIPRRRNIIVRPLLDATHAELVRYLLVRGIPWREDESNQDTSYLRNFVRNRIVPLAAERNAHVERAISASCDILGDENAFMEKIAAGALRTLARRSGEGLLVLDAGRLAASEIAVARRVVRQAVRQVAGSVRLDARHVEAVLACVAAGEGSVTLPGGIDVRMEFGTLTLRAASAREGAVAAWLALPGSMAVAGGGVLEASLVRLQPGVDPVAYVRSELAEWGKDRAFADAAALGFAERDLERLATSAAPGELPAEALAARLWVDGPEPGDVLCPLGMKGRSKKLSDLLGEEKIPVAERAGVPVVRTAPGGSIVWVAGVRADDRFKCGPTTRILVKLELRRVAGL